MPQAAFAIGLAELSERLALTGLEFVEAMGTGRLPLPPMAAVIPFRPAVWSLGAAEFRATPEDRFANPMGTTHGGWALTLLDTTMAIAACTTLDRGHSFATLDTSAKFVRPVTPKAGELRILGKVISRGRSIITVDGRVEDFGGKLYAHGTSTCQVIVVGSGQLVANKE